MDTKKVVILTTGQPSTNPRMVKEYQALKAAGYSVKVFYSYWQDWACKTDDAMFQSKEIEDNDFILVGGSPFENKIPFLVSKVFYKIVKFIYHRTGLLSHLSLSRTSFGLISAAKKTKADLYIAHNSGALPAAVMGAKNNKAKCAFDAEDFHRGEYKNPLDKSCLAVIQNEDKFLPYCDYISAASPLIANAYKKLYGTSLVEVVNNVFSIKFLQPLKNQKQDSLSLFWFSQTIGANRGLEAFLKALKRLPENVKVEIYFMGKVANGFEEVLYKLYDKNRLHFLDIIPPNEIFKEAAKYDIGLCIEETVFKNRDLCLTNKVFTYLLAGNCILFSDTKAQELFWNENKEVGFLFSQGDEFQIAAILNDLFNNRDKLHNAKAASLHLATTKMNWEMESKKLELLVVNTLQK